MRERQKTIWSVAVPGGLVKYYLNDVYQNDLPTYSIGVGSNSTEYMVDDPVGRGWKDVTHVRDNLYATSGGSASWGYGAVHPKLIGPNAYWKCWGFNPTYRAFDSGSYVYPITEEEQVQKAYSIFLSSGNEVNSLLNVIEAPQLPGSLKQLASTFQTRNVQSALSIISKGFLTYSFGLAPLLSDIGKLARYAKSVKTDLRKAAQEAGQRQEIRVTATGSIPANRLNLNGTDGGVAYLESGGKSERTVTVAGIRSHEYKSSHFQVLDRLLGKVGAGGPASFVWERIPFSFVVDWFLNTKLLFASLDNLLTGNIKRVDGVCITTKGDYSCAMIDQSTSSGIPGYNEYFGSAVASRSGSLYHRKVLRGPLPIKVTVRKGGFGKKQAALSAALLYEKIVAKRR
jgi:hypothetical protein